MSRQPKEPTWPFLCILACLFVLSAAAPRAWEKSIRTRDARPSADEAVSEAATDNTAQKELIAYANDTGTKRSPGPTQTQISFTIPSTNQTPSAPAMEEVGRLRMVAPSPRIALQAPDAVPVNFDMTDESGEVESFQLLPPYAENTGEGGTEEPRPFMIEELESYPAVEPGPVPLEETVSDPAGDSPEEIVPEAAEQGEMALSEAPDMPHEEPVSATADDRVQEIIPATVDDRDMNAVAGVSVLSPDQAAELAKEQDVARGRIDASPDWTVPVSIFEKLEPLSWDCDTGQWAREVTEAVSHASADVVANSATAKQSLARLSQLGRDGVSMAQNMQGTERFEEMRRALTMLHRRVVVWGRIVDATSGERNHPQKVDWKHVRRSIDQVQALTADGVNGSAWRTFLELDALAEIAARGAEGLTDEDLAVARLALLKLRVKDVTEEQRTFLESKQIADFQHALRAVVTEPIDAPSWVRWVETVERTGSPTLGEQLALERLKLSLSSLPAHRELAEQVQELYCGPNVRIAVTGYLLNRMLPDREPEYQWVRDTVLGHPVRGRSRTSADVGLALIPDSRRMRAALTVDGLVSASTSSTAGPATFFNDSESEYSAVKELELTPMGIHFKPAEVTVDNRTRLRQIRTEFDRIPLVSSLVQSVARSQHEMNRPAIRREMNRKVQLQAEKQIDDEIDARLGELNHRLKHRLLDPLAAMSLRPEVAEAETSEARMSMQLNLAGPSQLGSNTPRPWAPSDSVLSFQVHQSALNNVLLGLQLDGATMTIKDLRARIGQRFNRPELLEETTEHDDVLITFAPADAARIDFAEDRIAVSLGISRLRAGNRQWRDFRVRAYYRPESSRQSASLVRDGVVELVGPMRMGSQIALRSIFSKTFAKGRELSIVPAEMAADPRLKGLEVTQLRADDGWFALAVGPERIRPAMANSHASEMVK